MSTHDQPPTTAGVELAPGIRVSEGVLRWAFSRSGGPGGQNVNKVSTKAELRIGVDDLPVSGRVKSRFRTIAGKRIIGAEEWFDEENRPRLRGGDLVLTAETERSQSRNKSECLEKLREMLIAALAEPKVRRKTKPSRSSKARRVDAKKARGEIKKNRRGPGADQ